VSAEAAAESAALAHRSGRGGAAAPAPAEGGGEGLMDGGDGNAWSCVVAASDDLRKGTEGTGGGSVRLRTLSLELALPAEAGSGAGGIPSVLGAIARGPNRQRLPVDVTVRRAAAGGGWIAVAAVGEGVVGEDADGDGDAAGDAAFADIAYVSLSVAAWP
jgi:hypothetical protein